MMDLLLFTGLAETAQSADLAAQATLGKAVLGFLLVLGAITWVVQLSMYKVFKKAGRSGWIVFVPAYNLWVTFEICGKPGWWSLLCYVPVVGLIMTVVICVYLAKSFGEPVSFAAWLVLLPVIGFPMLARQEVEYQLPLPGKAKT